MEGKEGRKEGEGIRQPWGTSILVFMCESSSFGGSWMIKSQHCLSLGLSV